MAFKVNPLVLHLCRTLRPSSHASGRWVMRMREPEWAITAGICLPPILRRKSFSSISQLDNADGMKAVPYSKDLNPTLRRNVETC